MNKGVFNNLLKEFSKQAYISKSHDIYPIQKKRRDKKNMYDDSDEDQEKYSDDDDDEQEEENKNANQQKDDDIDNQSETSAISCMPEKNKKFEILQEISPDEFITIKKEFELCEEEEMTSKQFVTMMCTVVLKTKEYNIDLDPYILCFVELFELIDSKNKGKIGFHQLTNFMIDLQDILTRDETLFETKLSLCENIENYDHNPVEKLYAFQSSKWFGFLEVNMKQLRVINAKTLEQEQLIEFESSTFTCAVYIKYRNAFALFSNDKNISFFDLDQQKIVRKLPVPEAQIHAEYSQEKNTLYTANSQGIISCWDVERVYSKAFENQYINKRSFEKVLKQEPFREQLDVTCLLNIETLGMLAAGSNDTNIRLYDNQRTLSNNFKLLSGHIKGIKGIAFNEQNRYIASCSFEFDILIWNAYLEHPVAKLSGHDAPLVSVISPKIHGNFIISVDAKGVVKLWNLSDFSEAQSINVEEDQYKLFEKKAKKSQATYPEDTEKTRNMYRKQGTFHYKVAIFREKENKLILGSKKLSFYEFDQSFDPNLTDDRQILCIAYSPLNCEFYTGAGKNIRVWNFRLGKVQRVYKNIADSDITCLTLDSNERRLYLGQHSGKISCIDCLTGFKIKELNYHTKEICFLTTNLKNCLIISGGWDQTIRIFCDNRVQKNEDKRTSYSLPLFYFIIFEACLRTIKNISTSDLSSASFSENLLQIATVSRDNCLRFWDFEKGAYLYKIGFPPSITEITLIRFLDPFPIIAAADNSGFIYIWGLKQADQLSGKLLIKWKNMFTIQKAAVITSLDHQFKQEKQEGKKFSLDLILGDEMGHLRFLNLDELIKETKIQQFIPQEENRNFKRAIEVMNQKKFGSNNNTFGQYVFIDSEQDTYVKEEKPLIQEKKARQILQWKAHNDPIKCIQKIKETKETSYLTIGLDKMIKLWASNGDLILNFKQGNVDNDYKLDFKDFYKDKIQIQTQDVKKNFNSTLKVQQMQKKAQSIPFQKQNSNGGVTMNQMMRVESTEVFQELQEIDKYLDKQEYNHKKPDLKIWRENMNSKKLQEVRNNKVKK